MTAYSPAVPEMVDTEKLGAHSSRVRLLLALRGIQNKTQAEEFLNPDWERDTHDPFLLKDMHKAVERIMQAMKTKEHVALWSDYDMDGIPGAVVLHDYFGKVGYTNVSHYTPHRNKEGFGLNSEGIDELAAQGVTLVITIDCGSTDVEQVAYAKKQGIDVIITDHHLVPEAAPDAYAIVNPKQSDCTYPEQMLCGAGVAFKVVQALLQYAKDDETLQSPNDGWEKWLLDMVGMATVADMVPLVGENRVFAYYGLIVLKKSRRPGLQALLKKARANQRYLTEDDVAFTIAPRINAASRMGHAKDAFALLTSTDEQAAGMYASQLETVNKERKTIVATMKREIQRKLKQRDHSKDVIVLGNPEWKPSLLGLVAGSLVSEYHKPVFLWGREEANIIKGSCRSEGNPSVYALMQHAAEGLMSFGGHDCSGGFSLEDEHVHTLEQTLLEAYAVLGETQEAEARTYDDVLSVEEVTWDTYTDVARLAPFGEGNSKPIFYVKDAVLASVRTFGKGNEHLELQLQKNDGTSVKAIAFFTQADDLSKKPTVGEQVSLVAHLEASYFMGRRELRLRLVDVIA